MASTARLVRWICAGLGILVLVYIGAMVAYPLYRSDGSWSYLLATWATWQTFNSAIIALLAAIGASLVAVWSLNRRFEMDNALIDR